MIVWGAIKRGADGKDYGVRYLLTREELAGLQAAGLVGEVELIAFPPEAEAVGGGGGALPLAEADAEPAAPALPPLLLPLPLELGHNHHTSNPISSTANGMRIHFQWSLIQSLNRSHLVGPPPPPPGKLLLPPRATKLPAPIPRIVLAFILIVPPAPAPAPFDTLEVTPSNVTNRFTPSAF
jgi:hypothetical protein